MYIIQQIKIFWFMGAVNPFFLFFVFLHIIVAIPLNKKFSFFYDTFMHTFKDIHYFVTLSHYFKSLIYVMIGTRGCKMSKKYFFVF